MINVNIIGRDSGDRTVQVTVEEAFKMKTENPTFALIQDGNTITDQHQLKDGVDAALVPQIAGGSN